MSFSLLYPAANFALKTSVEQFCRNKQFALVENPGFWNWTFTLKDIDGKVLAEIDRDWRGFGFEVVSLLCAKSLPCDSDAIFSSPLSSVVIVRYAVLQKIILFIT